MSGSAANALVDFVYPPFCSLCGERTDRAQSAFLCGECGDQFRPTSPDWCSRCGAPVGPHLDLADGCVHCRDDRFAFDSVRALGVYEGPLRTVCRLGKEERGAALLAGLTALTFETHAAWFAAGAWDAIVPVPRHWTRRWWSTHDSARVVGRTLSRELGTRFVEGRLVKVRRTPAQSSLTASERRRNLSRAFAVPDGHPFAERRILLADDVLTTGTTAHRCARALREAGAASVDVAVIARGIGA